MNRKEGKLLVVLSIALIAIGTAFLCTSVYLAAKGTLVASIVSLASGFVALTSGAEMARGVS